jgi:hypothetical protein
VHEIEVTQHKMEDKKWKCGEILAIPYTLRCIDVCSTADDTGFLFNTHAWWYQNQTPEKLLTVNLCTIRKQTDLHYNLGRDRLGEVERVLFDGINNEHYALFCFNNKERHNIFVINSEKKFMNGKCPMNAPTISGVGSVDSILLHPDCNRMVYSTTKKLFIVDLFYNKKTAKIKTALIASEGINQAIKKAVFIGKNTYLACTAEDKLACFWLTKKNKIILKEHRGVSPMLDIAVDNSCITASGFRPRIAYVTTHGEVFSTSISEFKESKMFLSKTVPNPEKIFRLFYDKGQLGIVYRYNNRYENFLTWPDNLGPQSAVDIAKRCV